jgi:hypothetical protein
MAGKKILHKMPEKRYPHWSIMGTKILKDSRLLSIRELASDGAPGLSATITPPQARVPFDRCSTQSFLSGEVKETSPPPFTCPSGVTSPVRGLNHSADRPRRHERLISIVPPFARTPRILVPGSSQDSLVA